MSYHSTKHQIIFYILSLKGCQKDTYKAKENARKSSNIIFCTSYIILELISKDYVLIKRHIIVGKRCMASDNG